MTPEGITKRDIKKIIAKFGEDIESHWPVIGRLGAPTIDCNMVCWGWAVSIEAKSPGERPTQRQWGTISKKKRAGGIVLVIDGLDDSYEDLEAVLGHLHHASITGFPQHYENAKQRADTNIEKFLNSAPRR